MSNIDPKRVLIFSNHHRRSPYFETSMQRLFDAGYVNICIQNTGSGSFHKYIGPNLGVTDSGPVPYDVAMVGLKKWWNREDYDVVALMDNDCFLSGTSHFTSFVTEFVNDKYDYSCHMVNELDTQKYFADVHPEKIIAPVGKIEYVPSGDIYGFRPDPHFENAYLLMKASLWFNLPQNEFANSRQMLKAISESGAKIGAHKAMYRGTHSHFGQEWFHVGALMQFYHHLESKNLHLVNTSSSFDMARVGYFVAMEDCYGKDILPQNIKASVDAIVTKAGGRGTALQFWMDLTKDTCMEQWTK